MALVKTAYDAILALLTHDHLLVVRGIRNKNSLMREREMDRGAIKIRKGTRSTDWELVPERYEFLNFKRYDVMDCWAVAEYISRLFRKDDHDNCLVVVN